MTIRLIGIDCASKALHTVAAVADLDEGRLRWRRQVVSASFLDLVDDLAGQVTAGARAIVALDAPLGWPETFSSSLASHSAGERLLAYGDDLFRRATENRLRIHPHRMRPLEVAADKMARASSSALRLIQDLRTRSDVKASDGHALFWPLTYPFDLNDLPIGLSFIEVYPAATLQARGWSCSGYKGSKPSQRSARLFLANEVAAEFEDVYQKDVAEWYINDDALDAAVSVIAAADFARGLCDPAPVHDAKIRREGWIWVRRMSDAAPST